MACRLFVVSELAQSSAIEENSVLNESKIPRFELSLAQPPPYTYSGKIGMAFDVSIVPIALEIVDWSLDFGGIGQL
jgi:hypothetical protein